MALRTMLGQHSKIIEAQNGKIAEIRFFSGLFDRGYKWYLSLMPEVI